MSLSQLINMHGREQSPYMAALVNHLPMGQIALYKLTGDLSKVESYTEYYNRHFKVDSVSASYAPVSSIEECLGKKERYEACLDLMNKELENIGMEHMIKTILNTYPLGVSSGLFHVTIRLAYATEGVSYDEKLIEEVSRALAYYVTAYREVTPFYRKISKDLVHENMNQLIGNPEVGEILVNNKTLGQTIKSLYQNPEYLDAGFLIDGDEEQKVQGLLDLCLPAFDHTKSIFVLHCITGLHALLVLKDYFKDFGKALDIYTAAVITHLLTVDGIAFFKPDPKPILLSWSELIAKGSASKAVHTIKFTYSCHELYAQRPREDLKQSLIHQINS